MSILNDPETVGSIPTPSSTQQALYLDSTANTWYSKKSSGTSYPIGAGLSGQIDVTQNGAYVANPVIAGNAGTYASSNVTAINAIIAAAPSGYTIYFPPGIYQFNAAWTMPSTNKMFTFQGCGSNRAGSPATAFTEIQVTANLAGTFITLPGSSNGWYYQFRDLTFTSTATQSAGYVVDVNGNVGVNFRGVAFQSNGGTWYNIINYGGSNGGNQSLVEQCNLQGFTNYGITVNSNGSSVIISHTDIQGIWGTATQVAAACVVGIQVGALQIDNSDILGAVNNLLLSPTTGLVCASVYCINTYFDNASGSCILINGAGATVRTKFEACSFTCSSSGAGSYSAIQIAGSFVYTAAAAQGLDIINCNILNTFGATGTTNGILCTNAADINIKASRISGWTNGIQVTPIASVTQLMIEGNFIGSNAGYGVNSVGILLNAGTYLSQTICDNNLMNNTTAITDSTTVTTTANNNRLIMGNQGYNPKSTVAQPAVPATTVAVFNSTGVNCTVYVHTGTLTAITVGGVATGITAAATVDYSIPVAANQQIAITFSVAPTWTWIGS